MVEIVRLLTGLVGMAVLVAIVIYALLRVANQTRQAAHFAAWCRRRPGAILRWIGRSIGQLMVWYPLAGGIVVLGLLFGAALLRTG